MDSGIEKAVLRRRLLAARRPDPDGDRARDAHLAPLLAGRRVASYVAFGSEPVAPLPEGALVPVLLADGDLSWQVHRQPCDLGVDAVSACDVVLVPALAVGRDGVRLGRGGGSYDRALLRARGLVVALLHEGELLEAVPAAPHDVAVHAVALPSGLVRLTGRIAP